MIKIICDGCALETDEYDDPMWRTIEIDLGYLPGSIEHGSTDAIASYVLCHQCVDKLHTVDLTEAIAAVFAE